MYAITFGISKHIDFDMFCDILTLKTNYRENTADEKFKNLLKIGVFCEKYCNFMWILLKLF